MAVRAVGLFCQVPCDVVVWLAETKREADVPAALVTTKSELAVAKAELKEAEAKLKEAEAKLKEAKAELTAAEAKLTAAEAKLTTAKLSGDEEAIELARGGVKSANRGVENANRGVENANHGVTAAQSRVTSLTDHANALEEGLAKSAHCVLPRLGLSSTVCSRDYDHSCWCDGAACESLASISIVTRCGRYALCRHSSLRFPACECS